MDRSLIDHAQLDRWLGAWTDERLEAYACWAEGEHDLYSQRDSDPAPDLCASHGAHFGGCMECEALALTEADLTLEAVRDAVSDWTTDDLAALPLDLMSAARLLGISARSF